MAGESMTAKATLSVDNRQFVKGVKEASGAMQQMGQASTSSARRLGQGVRQVATVVGGSVVRLFSTLGIINQVTSLYSSITEGMEARALEARKVEAGITSRALGGKRTGQAATLAEQLATEEQKLAGMTGFSTLERARQNLGFEPSEALVLQRELVESLRRQTRQAEEFEMLQQRRLNALRDAAEGQEAERLSAIAASNDARLIQAELAKIAAKLREQARQPLPAVPRDFGSGLRWAEDY